MRGEELGKGKLGRRKRKENNTELPIVKPPLAKHFASPHMAPLSETSLSLTIHSHSLTFSTSPEKYE